MARASGLYCSSNIAGMLWYKCQAGHFLTDAARFLCAKLNELFEMASRMEGIDRPTSTHVVCARNLAEPLQIQVFKVDTEPNLFEPFRFQA